MLLIEDQLDYCNRRWTVLLEDQPYYWKISCVVGRSVVLLEDQILLEDQLYYWKINHVVGRMDCIIGRSTVLLEDQLYCWKISGIIR